MYIHAPNESLHFPYFQRLIMKLTGKRLLLLLLYSSTKKKEANVPIVGRTRLMKMVFLFEKELLDEFEKNRTFEEIALPEFFAWKYGTIFT